MAVLSLFNFLGASVFVAVGQALLQNRLVLKLKPIIPDVDASTLANGGATSFRAMVSSDQLPAVLDAYNDSIRSIWYLALGLSCLILLASFGMEWKSVKQSTTKDAEEGFRNEDNMKMEDTTSSQLGEEEEEEVRSK